MKSNAKEYLKEFAISQQGWLKALIYDAIESNGNVTNERKNKIFKHLTDGADLNVTEPNINEEDLESEIYITKLIHKSGVNALKENQTIKFTKDVTILYGLNGAGKSSYFKVLNEIVGGNQKKEILPNIYAETTKPIEIELKFEEKGKQSQTINWDGSNRSFDLLNKYKVFDTSYIKGLLETRKAVECSIDEVVFNNQLPTKYSNKNSRIAWGELKKLNNDSVTIDKLETLHGRLSGGAMHNGTENEENPIEIQEFNTMISDIETILDPSDQ